MFNRAYIEITNLCNFHCDFCPGTTRPPMAMRLSDFRTAAEKLRPLTDYLYLHVMGEPLLHPQLPRAGLQDLHNHQRPAAAQKAGHPAGCAGAAQAEHLPPLLREQPPGRAAGDIPAGLLRRL